MDLIKQKILITGAPSSGKSTTMLRLAEVFHDQAVLIPESARILLLGGFPPPQLDDIKQIYSFQQVINQVQKGLEFMVIRQNFHADLMIFDRSILDGAAFWPKGISSYLEEFNVDIHDEYLRFNYVLFFELPEKSQFGGKNKQRFHDYEQSVESEEQLRMLWENHPHLIEIKATTVFEEKIETAVDIIKKIADKMQSSDE